MQYLAVDIGGTEVKLGIVTDEGKVLRKAACSADFDDYRTPLMQTALKGAEDFVRQKLAPADPVKDGKQTPMHGHPVFKAMHATACCCRGCLNKWYRVPMHKELTESEQQKIVNLLMAWIERHSNGERK